ncbi:MAG: 3'(2'),5'-bisphosphate nucleotidase [Phycisphaerales bacterium]|nr:3'(2'),5'-bisphosphate nucleotidase [Phycisphaerales bacterium]
MHSTPPLLQPALQAVATASALTRAVQLIRKEVEAHTKDDRSPVTVADYAAQAIVSMVLAENLEDPHDRLLVGEENAAELRQDDHAAIRSAVTAAVQRWRPGVSQDDVLSAIDACDHDGTAEAYWTLDPIDGTKGFLRGAQYAIALGRIEGGSVVLGVLGCPNLSIDPAVPPAEVDPNGEGSLYAAALECGAWEFPHCDPHAQPLRIQCPVWSEDRPIRPCASVEAGHSNRSDTDTLLSQLGVDTDPVRLDSQAKYAVLARGQADAYLRLPTRSDYREKIWDHAAGSLVATEAGGVVSDVVGRPLDFTHGVRLECNRGVIAAAAGLHEKLIEASASLGIGVD